MSADFLDTNVFVYAFDRTDERKREVARHLIADTIERHTGSISHQVVQETLNVLVKKSRFGVAPAQAYRFAEELLLPLWDIMPHAGTYRRCLDLAERYGYSFYDSLIIASAIDGGCRRILSEDLQHGQRIESVVIEDPFR